MVSALRGPSRAFLSAGTVLPGLRSYPDRESRRPRAGSARCHGEACQCWGEGGRASGAARDTAKMAAFSGASSERGGGVVRAAGGKPWGRGNECGTLREGAVRSGPRTAGGPGAASASVLARAVLGRCPRPGLPLRLSVSPAVGRPAPRPPRPPRPRKRRGGAALGLRPAGRGSGAREPSPPAPAPGQARPRRSGAWGGLCPGFSGLPKTKGPQHTSDGYCG